MALTHWIIDMAISDGDIAREKVSFAHVEEKTSDRNQELNPCFSPGGMEN